VNKTIVILDSMFSVLFGKNLRSHFSFVIIFRVFFLLLADSMPVRGGHIQDEAL